MSAAAQEAARLADDRIIEKAFEQIGAQDPMSFITRSDVRQWLDLLRPLIAERIVVSAPADGVRTWIGGNTVADLLDTIHGYIADGYTSQDLIIEGITQ
ncbi:MAG: hypothetical protein K0Q52_169 [Microbacterium sp.]|nr:hypothetical protein [Microbacterium sp.]